MMGYCNRNEIQSNWRLLFFVKLLPETDLYQIINEHCSGERNRQTRLLLNNNIHIMHIQYETSVMAFIELNRFSNVTQSTL